MNHPIVSESDWNEARKLLLVKEKELARQRDELTKLRQQLPWHKIEKEYEFEAREGKLKLTDLFGPHSQLLVYHFMFGPDWEEGCPICSMAADHYDPLVVHLQARDVSLVTISRAPFSKLDAYQKRMDWSFPWLSSQESDFNHDFGVHFTSEEIEASLPNYNYGSGTASMTELPGISSFHKNDAGEVFHTYSAYARGLENILGIYNFLDMVPKGRGEQSLPYGLHWVRRHDCYDDESFVEIDVQLKGTNSSKHNSPQRKQQ